MAVSVSIRQVADQYRCTRYKSPDMPWSESASIRISKVRDLPLPYPIQHTAQDAGEDGWFGKAGAAAFWVVGAGLAALAFWSTLKAPE